MLEGWIAIAARFGHIQTLLLLTIFYLILIGPVSLVQAMGRRDQLEKRGLWQDGSAWHDADTAGADLDRAKLLS
jgi:hypothetical protein